MFIGFALLAYLFPYTGDDWAWGSRIGIERLQNLFADYNGRYAGNLMVLALTRSKFLDTLVMAASFVLICILSYRYSESNITAVLLFSAFAFFLMPKEMWAQAVVWTAGFSNYVPSALISVSYLVYAKESAGMKLYENNSVLKHGIWMFILGFVGAMFVENVTVFNICLAFAGNIFLYIKVRKMDYAHAGFLLGTLSGTYAMFSNGAYNKIMQGTDYYRDTPDGILEMMPFVTGQAENLTNYIIYNNLIFVVVVTVLLVILAVWKIIKRKKSPVGALLVAVNIGCFQMLRRKDAIWPKAERWFGLSDWMSGLVPTVIALLYVLSVLLAIWYFVEEKRRVKMLIPLLCAAVALAPLLVVSPIGARCTFIAYAFMILFAADLFGYICKGIAIRKSLMSGVFGVVVLVQLLMFLRIFYPIHYYDALRLDFAKKQEAEGKKTVLMCDLPNAEYLWNALPIYGNLTERYKLFYELADDLVFEYIPYQELELLTDREL